MVIYRPHKAFGDAGRGVSKGWVIEHFQPLSRSSSHVLWRSAQYTGIDNMTMRHDVTP